MHGGPVAASPRRLIHLQAVGVPLADLQIQVPPSPRSSGMSEPVPRVQRRKEPKVDIICDTTTSKRNGQGSETAPGTGRDTDKCSRNRLPASVNASQDCSSSDLLRIVKHKPSAIVFHCGAADNQATSDVGGSSPSPTEEGEGADNEDDDFPRASQYKEFLVSRRRRNSSRNRKCSRKRQDAHSNGSWQKNTNKGRPEVTGSQEEEEAQQNNGQQHAPDQLGIHSVVAGYTVYPYSRAEEAHCSCQEAGGHEGWSGMRSERSAAEGDSMSLLMGRLDHLNEGDQEVQSADSSHSDVSNADEEQRSAAPCWAHWEEWAARLASIWKQHQPSRNGRSRTREGRAGSSAALKWLRELVSRGGFGCGSLGESREGNRQSSGQAGPATDQAALPTSDPQQAADPLVPLVPDSSPRPTGPVGMAAPAVVHISTAATVKHKHTAAPQVQAEEGRKGGREAAARMASGSAVLVVLNLMYRMIGICCMKMIIRVQAVYACINSRAE
ncbi:hypothetical protein EYF80_038593 [Liparis tanakae]|uniref:Uncharacterized protein n=1 Tax=Liparis tanakae TaxID=230148 RepID=A0A4Z2GCX6_9TELE|nr:hypothetical protein EYF80_038593 [Liparis tanakae]